MCRQLQPAGTKAFVSCNESGMPGTVMSVLPGHQKVNIEFSQLPGTVLGAALLPGAAAPLPELTSKLSALLQVGGTAGGAVRCSVSHVSTWEIQNHGFLEKLR